MKINQTSEIKTPTLENIKLSSADSFHFELEVPDFNLYIEKQKTQENNELVNQLDTEEQVKKADIKQIAQDTTKINEEALAKINELAQTDDVPVKISKIDDIRLLIHSKNLFRLKDEYNTKIESLSKDDIDFIKQCFENKEMTLNTVKSSDFQAHFAISGENGQVQYKSYNFSKGLFNLIDYSFKNNKPVRLDFQGNSSVILKMNKEGKLIAEFLTNDKAMEHILKSSIPHLKNKLDTEGIPYKEILYKDSKNRQNKKRNKGEQQ